MTEPLERLRSVLGDRYVLERQAGEGGMATVFLAKDTRHERSVAIKVLRPELSASLGADRFLREIRLAATLQHPNILGLYDSGEADGLLYYVMPYIEGESLRHRVDREQSLPIHDALRITREAAEALDYAHKHGIVHRDIKPENILLLGGHALVADFGIARAVSEAGGEKLTQTGMAIGTPYYMSPEQSMGSDRVDGRSDVYSLGCVLYELLIGQPPFTGPNAVAIMARHSMEKVPSLQVVRSAVPDEVEDIVMRALEKTPADRFQSMEEMVEALTEAEADATMQRTAARRAATGARRIATGAVAAPAAPAPTARRKTVWTVASVAVLLLIGAGGWMLRDKEQAAAMAARSSDAGLDAHRIAVRYFANEGGGDSLAFVASGLTEGLISRLGEVPGLSVISGNGVAPFKGDSIPSDSVARALNVGTFVDGRIEQKGDRLRVSVHLIDGASGVDLKAASFEQQGGSVLAVQDTLAEKVAGLIRAQLGTELRLREQRARTTNADAWVRVQRAEAARKQAEAFAGSGGTTQAVERAYDRADSIYAEAQALDPRWAEPFIGRADIAYRRSRMAVDDPVKAKPWITRGEQFADSALARDPQNPDALEARGTLRYWSWLLGLEPDPVAAKALFSSAQNDLETAVRVKPGQAGAWAILSHLYNQTAGEETDAALAAQRAYEADAYLGNADQVLSRLFLASYDLAQFVAATKSCEEGQRRFPKDAKFVSCQLWMLTTKAVPPDPDLAWRLADSIPKLVAASDRPFETLKARLAVAAVLARKGLTDSSAHVADRARGNSDVDPTRDLAYIEAFVRTLLDDKPGAIKALKVYLAVNPDRRQTLSDDPGWWFRGIQDYPAFQDLVRTR